MDLHHGEIKRNGGQCQHHAAAFRDGPGLRVLFVRVQEIAQVAVFQHDPLRSAGGTGSIDDIRQGGRRHLQARVFRFPVRAERFHRQGLIGLIRREQSRPLFQFILRGHAECAARVPQAGLHPVVRVFRRHRQERAARLPYAVFRNGHRDAPRQENADDKPLAFRPDLQQGMRQAVGLFVQFPVIEPFPGSNEGRCFRHPRGLLLHEGMNRPKPNRKIRIVEIAVHGSPGTGVDLAQAILYHQLCEDFPVSVGQCLHKLVGILPCVIFDPQGQAGIRRHQVHRKRSVVQGAVQHFLPAGKAAKGWDIPEPAVPGKHGRLLHRADPVQVRIGENAVFPAFPDHFRQA